MSRVVRVVQSLTLLACAVTVVMLFVYDPAPEQIVVPDGEDPGETLGAAVFAGRCASCHGERGEGGYGPALADGVVLASFPDVAAQIAFVEAGTGTMPGFVDQLSREEIEAVVTFTRDGLAGSEPSEAVEDPDLAALGAQVYADTCTGCHGAEGEGGFGPELAGGAVVAAYPDAADQRAVLETGRGAMPSYEGELTSEQIAAVVAYTRAMP